ncbi:dihydrodipicolinate synthase family protein [Candidatus Pelagibacter sp.]|nr:dihydrodipicolinate synthase family protein [Candidatus Pelagibacter sp.]
MSKVNGIYAATLSILNDDLSLNIKKTINHAESIIELGCHGVVFFGSTGQSQLISLSEKIQMINNLPSSQHKEKFIIGTGLNSLADTINLMRISQSNRLNKFLIMPPAYYKYEDDDVINFYSKIIEALPESEILLYNFEKLSGYVFSLECIEKLVSKFPKQIIGVKDSSYNLYKKLKIDNFSVMPGSEIKLLEGLSIGCSGVITATANVTASLARSVYDDFSNKKDQTQNQKLCEVRRTFDKFNLISGLHTFLNNKDNIFKNLLPPLHLLPKEQESELETLLKGLDFDIDISSAA